MSTFFVEDFFRFVIYRATPADKIFWTEIEILSSQLSERYKKFDKHP